jgi:hypothetical protein
MVCPVSGSTNESKVGFIGIESEAPKFEVREGGQNLSWLNLILD